MTVKLTKAQRDLLWSIQTSNEHGDDALVAMVHPKHQGNVEALRRGGLIMGERALIVTPAGRSALTKGDGDA